MRAVKGLRPLARPASPALSPALPGPIRPSGRLFPFGPFVPGIRHICLSSPSLEVKLCPRRRLVVVKRCRGKLDAAARFWRPFVWKQKFVGEVLLLSLSWFRAVAPSQESFPLLFRPQPLCLERTLRPSRV